MKKINQFPKRINKNFKNTILKWQGKRHSKNYDIKNTIIIAGVPRGGTTWLLEILLNSLPNSCGIWEPLMLPTDVRLKELSFSWREYIEPDRDWREAETLFRDIFSGINLNVSNIFKFSWFEYLKQIQEADRYIVKFCRANRLLKWVTTKFKTQLPILLIRHPCAVVASQLSHGAWARVSSDHPYLNLEYIKKRPWIKKIIDNVNTPEEKLTVTWCLDYYIPLSEPNPHPWTLTTYEKLVNAGEDEIKRIFQSLEQEVPKSVDEYLRMPSRSTRMDSNVMQGKNPLTTWKIRLSEEQQNNILDIVTKFGLDFYTENLEPDYKRLYEEPIQK